MAHLPDYSRVTIDDVATRAGVSTATVSRVLNGTGPVSETTATRVRDAVTALGYAPHAAARVLASRRTNTIGLVLSEIAGEFFGPMLRGIEAGTRKYGFELLIHCTYQSDSEHPRHIYPLGEHNTDGIIVFVDSLDESELLRLHQRHFPIVLLHRSAPQNTAIPYVGFQNRQGAYQLVEYLIVHRGYRRIAFLAGPPHAEDSYWRQKGYEDALNAHNIQVDPNLIALGDFDERQGQVAVAQLLADGVVFDAIFAADDESAIGAMAALKHAGLRVPQDVALAGFDDTRLSRYLDPPLTTVRAPIEGAGFEAVTQLVSLIQKGQAASVTLLPTKLVVRRSCGAAVDHSSDIE